MGLARVKRQVLRCDSIAGPPLLWVFLKETIQYRYSKTCILTLGLASVCFNTGYPLKAGPSVLL